MTEDDWEECKKSPIKMKQLKVDVKRCHQHLNNGYTNLVENQISNLYEKINSLKMLHNFSSEIIKKRKKYIYLPSRILAGLIGSGSAIDIIMNFKTFGVSNYVLSIITIISSLFNIIDSFSDYSTKEYKHGVYISRLEELAQEVELNMSLPFEDRHEGISFLTQVGLKFSHLSNGSSPEILDKANELLEKEIEEKGLTFNIPFSLHKLEEQLNPQSITPRSVQL